MGDGKVVGPLCMKVPSSGDLHICPIKSDGQVDLNPEGVSTDSPSAWAKLRNWDFCIPELPRTTEDVDEESIVRQVENDKAQLEQLDPQNAKALEDSVGKADISGIAVLPII